MEVEGGAGESGKTVVGGTERVLVTGCCVKTAGSEAAAEGDVEWVEVVSFDEGDWAGFEYHGDIEKYYKTGCVPPRPHQLSILDP